MLAGAGVDELGVSGIPQELPQGRRIGNAPVPVRDVDVGDAEPGHELPDPGRGAGVEQQRVHLRCLEEAVGDVGALEEETEVGVEQHDLGVARRLGVEECVSGRDRRAEPLGAALKDRGSDEPGLREQRPRLHQQRKTDARDQDAARDATRGLPQPPEQRFDRRARRESQQRQHRDQEAHLLRGERPRREIDRRRQEGPPDDRHPQARRRSQGNEDDPEGADAAVEAGVAGSSGQDHPERQRQIIGRRSAHADRPLPFQKLPAQIGAPFHPAQVSIQQRIERVTRFDPALHIPGNGEDERRQHQAADDATRPGRGGARDGGRRARRHDEGQDAGETDEAREFAARHGAAAEPRQDQRRQARGIEVLPRQRNRHEEEEREGDIDVGDRRLVEQDLVAEDQRHRQEPGEARGTPPRDPVNGEEQQTEEEDLQQLCGQIVVDDQRERVQQLDGMRPVRVNGEGHPHETAVGDIELGEGEVIGVVVPADPRSQREDPDTDQHRGRHGEGQEMRAHPSPWR